MGGRVVVVTDSTAYLPVGLADELSVRVVPLQVVLGGLLVFATGILIGSA